MVDEPDTKKPAQTETNKPAKLAYLRLTDVVPSDTNPRLNLDKEPFEELKRSIERNGLLQPIVVRPRGDRFEIIGGHRRHAALTALGAEHPDEKRYTHIPAVIRIVDDDVVPVLQLAENINRSDLSALEVAEGIARALQGGLSSERLAEQLGWSRRNLHRYVQLQGAPAWLKQMAKEVKVTKKKLDESGKPIIDEESEQPVLEVERLPALPFTYVIELVTLYNVLHEHDCLQLEELGGDGFKPQAERVVRRLGTTAAVEGWTTAKLRAEIKRAKDPAPAKQSGERATSSAPALIANDKKLTLDMNKAKAMSVEELSLLGARLTEALKELGFKKALVALE